MRAVLLDWLMEICHTFGFHEDTMAAAVVLLDVYLSRCRISKMRFQLLGSGCLLLASKMREKATLAIKEFTALADGAFQAHDVSPSSKCFLVLSSHS